MRPPPIATTSPAPTCSTSLRILNRLAVPVSWTEAAGTSVSAHGKKNRVSYMVRVVRSIEYVQTVAVKRGRSLEEGAATVRSGRHARETQVNAGAFRIQQGHSGDYHGGRGDDMVKDRAQVTAATRLL